ELQAAHAGVERADRHAEAPRLHLGVPGGRDAAPVELLAQAPQFGLERVRLQLEDAPGEAADAAGAERRGALRFDVAEGALQRVDGVPALEALGDGPSPRAGVDRADGAAAEEALARSCGEAVDGAGDARLARLDALREALADVTPEAVEDLRRGLDAEQALEAVDDALTDALHGVHRARDHALHAVDEALDEVLAEVQHLLRQAAEEVVQ